MTRLGFFLFNLLLVVSVYGLIYLNYAKNAQDAAVAYALHNFSTPYMTLLLLMCLVATVRWFMSHDTEVAREIVTWLNALWLVPLLTALALYLMGAMGPHFWQQLHGLSTLR